MLKVLRLLSAALQSFLKVAVRLGNGSSALLRLEIPHHIYDRYAAWFQGSAIAASWYLFKLYPAFTLQPIPTGFAIGFLAFAAAIMAVRAESLTGPEKFIWIIICAGLLVWELEVIHEDRAAQDSQHEQDVARLTAQFELTLREFRETQFRLAQTKQNLDQTKQDLDQTGADEHRRLVTLLQQGAAITDQQRSVLQTQQDISEQFAGRLVPGTALTPMNGCTDSRIQIRPDATTVLIGNGNAAITDSLPSSVLQVGDAPVIAFDQKPNSGEMYLSIDFRDNQNRVILRVNKNGIVSRTAQLAVLRPNKSTLLIEDDFGKEFLRASFLNPHAFEVTGKIVYCGKAIELTKLFPATNSCSIDAGKSAFAVAAPKCPNDR